MIHFVLLLNRQGKTRLAKWFSTYTAKQRARFSREVSTLVLNRNARYCNIIEWKEHKLIYKRYSSCWLLTGDHSAMLDSQ
jgi:AP-1 complex subunit sigma 1/2